MSLNGEGRPWKTLGGPQNSTGEVDYSSLTSVTPSSGAAGGIVSAAVKVISDGD